MLPSSFFFHQAAEIGLSPSQFLTYIIRTSLQERVQDSTEHTQWGDLLKRLDTQIDAQKERKRHRKKIAVVLGGYSSERHISVESGRNVFEKLSSSDKYEPIPIFLTGNEQQMALYQLPMNLLLKDNADDIALKIAHFNKHPVVEGIKVQCRYLTDKYASAHTIFEPQAVSIEQLAKRVDGVFIALHGRPGEDGKLQSHLARVGLRYNGSSPQSSALTINKYDTLQLLARHGFTVTRQLLLDKADYNASVRDSIRQIESQFAYPFIAKPVDDGCSSAVKKIKSTEQLQAYLAAIFRNEGDEIPIRSVQVLHLMPKEEFPAKRQVLIEELITARGAARFLEITGGLLTHHQPDGSTTYEMFEPSEALAGKDILSLEEKFLAGEGQNITPARYSDNPQDYAYIAAQVKATLQKAAEILQVSGYARIDAFVRIFNNQQVETVIVEVNSLPGMTPATCIFHQCALNGYKPYDFIDKILEFGLNE
jgi:UDP-N-acetylmuramate--alanine ligase